MPSNFVPTTQEPDFKHLPLYLKFNTGMNRLGIELSEIEDVILQLKKYKRQSIEHVMSHFSSSYIPFKEGNRTFRQYNKFNELVKDIKGAGIEINETSCANSGAIEQGYALECSHIRPGLMLYGAKCSPKSLWKGQCISDLKTKILKICQVQKGTPIGYGGHVSLSLYGKEAKILGRVNMDITTIFFKELPPELKVGGDFFLWGENVSEVTELASQLKTTAYQVFTAITSRVPRRYLT